MSKHTYKHRSPGLGVSVSNSLNASLGMPLPQLNGIVGEATFQRNILLSTTMTGPLHILPSLNVRPDLPIDCICKASVSERTEVSAPAVSKLIRDVENALVFLDRPAARLNAVLNMIVLDEEAQCTIRKFADFVYKIQFYASLTCCC